MPIEWNRVTWYSKTIAVFVYIATFAVAFFLGVSFQKFAHERGMPTPIPNEDHRVPPAHQCPADAMLCPDGSSVSRTGPHCTFAECPEVRQATPTPGGVPEDDMVFCTMDAKICPDGSAVGRVGPNCEFAPCP